MILRIYSSVNCRQAHHPAAQTHPMARQRVKTEHGHNNTRRPKPGHRGSFTWPIGLLILLAVVGCSVHRKPAGKPDTTGPRQPVVANMQDRTTPTPIATESPGPTVPPTAAQTLVPDESPANTRTPANTTATYRIRAGDTLWGIAITHGVSLESILSANNLQDPDDIRAGQELVIPNASTAVARAVPEMATRPPPTPADLAAGEHPQPPRLNNPAPTTDLQPLPNKVLLEPMLHDWQKMNNCAPTTVAMALSYYNRPLTQFDIAPALKGSVQDKNVSPPEIVAYMHDQGFGGIARVNGDIETLQRLVSHQIPVIVEQWLDRPGDELTGHYRLVRGYDQTTQEIIVNDSYSGPTLHFSYAEFDRLWRPFNRVYIPVYQLEREPVVKAIVGNDWDDDRMYQRATRQAQTEIENQGDAYAWFNLGSSLLGVGENEPAADAFDMAIEIGLPPRMFWYQFGAFEAYNRAGQFQRVIELSAPLVNLALEELHYQRAVAYEGLGNRAAALVEYQRAIALNPRLTKAARAAARLAGADGS